MKRVTVTEIALVAIGLGIGWLLIGQALQGRLTLADIWAVSYTHLTLPTSDLV